MTIEVIATKRVEQGTGASRRLRRAGKVPAIVYGAGEPASIELDHNSLYFAMQEEVFHASVLNLVVDGKAEPVVIRDAQYHPWKQVILHVDFQRVDANKKMHVKVPLHFINADVAPGVKTSGGIVSHIINDLDIECLPANIPTSITVDLMSLEAGHSIHLSDLVLPAGVESVALKGGNNNAVATILAVRGAATE